MTSILNNIQMKLESIEDRLGKVERLNQRYIERNFDLMQENQDLIKSKDSSKILERLFLFLVGSMNSGGMIGNSAQGAAMAR